VGKKADLHLYCGEKKKVPFLRFSPFKGSRLLASSYRLSPPPRVADQAEGAESQERQGGRLGDRASSYKVEAVNPKLIGPERRV
jgi:hypothetical protein